MRIASRCRNRYGEAAEREKRGNCSRDPEAARVRFRAASLMSRRPGDSYLSAGFGRPGHHSAPGEKKVDLLRRRALRQPTDAIRLIRFIRSIALPGSCRCRCRCRCSCSCSCSCGRSCARNRARGAARKSCPRLRWRRATGSGPLDVSTRGPRGGPKIGSPIAVADPGRARTIPAGRAAAAARPRTR